MDVGLDVGWGLGLGLGMNLGMGMALMSMGMGMGIRIESGLAPLSDQISLGTRDKPSSQGFRISITARMFASFLLCLVSPRLSERIYRFGTLTESRRSN